jgi:glycosyltransferase involved in cell wall biosynthesis
MSALALSVVVPAYNEAESLAATASAIEAAVADPTTTELVLVNDGSSDRTIDEMRGIAERSALTVRIVDRPQNGGLGAALASGCGAATGDVITWIPGDGEYDLTEVLPGIALLESSDVVLVRRRSRGQAGRNLLSSVMYFMIRVLFRFDARNYCGIFVIPNHRLRSLNVRSEDVFFTLEIALRCSHQRLGIDYLEAEWRPRRAGRSKVFNVRTVLRNALELFEFRWNLWRGR